MYSYAPNSTHSHLLEWYCCANQRAMQQNPSPKEPELSKNKCMADDKFFFPLISEEQLIEREIQRMRKASGI